MTNYRSCYNTGRLTNLRLFGLSLIMVVLMFKLAMAEEQPTLKQHVRVTGEVVTLGDLFAGLIRLADKPVFYAPDPGTTGVLSLDQISEAAVRAGLNDFVTGQIAKVRITRLATNFGRKELTRLIGSYIMANELAKDSDLDDSHLEVNIFGHVPAYKIALDGRSELKGLDYSPQSGQFSAEIDLGMANLLRVTGRVVITVPVTVAARALPRGVILRPSDLAIGKIKKSANNGYLAMQHLLGRITTRPLGANQPITDRDVALPYLVKRNEMITVIYRAGGMFLTIRAKALNDGAKDEFITVLNQLSGKKIEVIVESPGVARLLNHANTNNR